ncbi:MAG: transcriptional regulator [Thalassobaculum sp.]|uniref:transcriptional regulator n=1 Tax=Thalassobaculum sp. TaxID=2022740 RepID=UPI0032ED4547
MARRPKIIPPRADLKQKAVNFRDGFDLRLTPEVVRKLEEVVHKSRDAFTADIAERLVAMRRLLRESRPEPEQQRAMIAEIYDNSLEIKGAGGTIGYDLLSQIGKSLNDFVSGLETLEDRQARVVGLHIDALYAVLANRITGRGGIVESAIVQAFGEARRKFRAEPGDGEPADGHEREA